MRKPIAFLVIASLAAVSARAADPAPKSASPAPAAAAKPAPPEDSTVEGRQYVYDPAGRRDPFKSLLVRERSRESRP